MKTNKTSKSTWFQMLKKSSHIPRPSHIFLKQLISKMRILGQIRSELMNLFISKSTCKTCGHRGENRFSISNNSSHTYF